MNLYMCVSRSIYNTYIYIYINVICMEMNEVVMKNVNGSMNQIYTFKNIQRKKKEKKSKKKKSLIKPKKVYIPKQKRNKKRRHAQSFPKFVVLLSILVCIGVCVYENVTGEEKKNRKRSTRINVGWIPIYGRTITGRI